LEFRGLCPQCQQGRNQPHDARASAVTPSKSISGATHDTTATIA
jgi:hypothetical protein